MSDIRKRQLAAEATTLTRERTGYTALAREHQRYAEASQLELNSYTESEQPPMPPMRRVSADTSGAITPRLDPTHDAMTIADIEQQAAKINDLLASRKRASLESWADSQPTRHRRDDTEDPDGQDGGN